MYVYFNCAPASSNSGYAPVARHSYTLSIDAHCRNQPNKSKLMLHNPLLSL